MFYFSVIKLVRLNQAMGCLVRFNVLFFCGKAYILSYFVQTYEKSGLGGESEPLAPRLRLEFDKILDMLVKCYMMIDL